MEGERKKKCTHEYGGRSDGYPPLEVARRVQALDEAEGEVRRPETERGGVAEHIGALESDSLEVGSLEVGALEVGALEVGALEVGALEVGALEVGCGEGVERKVGGGRRL